MSKLKILLYFLAALMVLFILKGIFFGMLMFVVVLKYMAIAAVFAGVIYFLSKKSKKDSE
jgi:hypothetical protein